MSVKAIDIVPFSHTDFGYTDHPSIALELHQRYIDEALDAIEDTADRKPGERFRWTCESLHVVQRWWQRSDGLNRERFLAALASGGIEVTGYPFNATALFDDAGWDMMFDWIPGELWRAFHISAGMQNDVGGVPVASVVRAARKGIRSLFVGLNGYNGDPPFDVPSAFRWRLPEGGNVFVWLNPGYWNGYDLFNEGWRLLPCPSVDDLAYRCPERGDYFREDAEGIRAAHTRCRETLRELEGTSSSPENPGGFNNRSRWGAPYRHGRLIAALVGQWRSDNDPPFPPVVDFVARWNSMGLEPVLRIATVSEALQSLEQEIGGQVPERTGEWTDWWIHGAASSPVALAASRKAKRLIKETRSGLCGSLDPRRRELLDTAARDLCLFDEHTWGHWGSVSFPYSALTAMQEGEKAARAFRPLMWAGHVQAECLREKLAGEPDGVFVTNATTLPKSEWIELHANCLRGTYTHLRNAATAEEARLRFKPGIELLQRPATDEDFSLENVSRTIGDAWPGRTIAFWSGEIMPGETVRFDPVRRDADPGPTPESPRSLDVVLDRQGWPRTATWEQMGSPLFTQGIAEFLSCKPIGFTPRNVLKDIFYLRDPKERSRAIADRIVEARAVYRRKATLDDGPHTLIVEQRFEHPALEWGIRRLQLWKHTPRARVSVRMNRKSSMSPEVFYLMFPFSCEGIAPSVSSGGYVFTPGSGQLPGCYMDYLAIDGWVQYRSERGQWLWCSQDSPLISFGGPQLARRNRGLPEGTHRILSIVFDNTWDTNFVADSHGIFQFTYDLSWSADGSLIPPAEATLMRWRAILRSP